LTLNLIINPIQEISDSSIQEGFASDQRKDLKHWNIYQANLFSAVCKENGTTIDDQLPLFTLFARWFYRYTMRNKDFPKIDKVRIFWKKNYKR